MWQMVSLTFTDTRGSTVPSSLWCITQITPGIESTQIQIIVIPLHDIHPVIPHVETRDVDLSIFTVLIRLCEV